jgi:starvation-inducible DNA-binding protein
MFFVDGNDAKKSLFYLFLFVFLIVKSTLSFNFLRRFIMVMRIDIGIDEMDRRAIASGLSRLLADTYSLYLKTHYFHWNVTGPMFQTLHLMFETQYNELALAVDAIAERIRSLGETAPGTYREFARLSSIAESDGVPKAREMIVELVQAQEAVVRTARSIFQTVDKASDEATADLLTQRIQLHEKTAWMLRSLLED